MSLRQESAGHLEQSLAQSIHRAKLKLNQYGVTSSRRTDKEEEYLEKMEKGCATLANSRRENNTVVAAAIKKLQSRIGELENQKVTLANQLDKLISKGGKTDANTHEAEYLKLKTMQKQTQNRLQLALNQCSKLKQQNSRLYETVNGLQNRIHSISEQRNISQSIQNTYQHKLNDLQVQQKLFEGRQYEFNELNRKYKQSLQQIEDLKVRNATNKEIIEQLMRQIEIEKKNNIVQIRLHQEQILKEENDKQEQEKTPAAEKRGRTRSGKQNDDENRPQLSHTKNNEHLRRQISQLKSKNEQLYRMVQRNKATLSKQIQVSKGSLQKYDQLKLVVHEVFEQIRQLPTHNINLKYLMLKIGKIEAHHLKNLRSNSNSCKLRLSSKSSTQKSGKKATRPLKMEDLNSDSKNSRSMSRVKCKPQVSDAVFDRSHSNEPLKLQSDRSNPKPQDQTFESQIQLRKQIQFLTKQVSRLKKQHRNLMIKTANIQIEGQDKDNVDRVINDYNDKKQRLDMLKTLILQGGTIQIRNKPMNSID